MSARMCSGKSCYETAIQGKRRCVRCHARAAADKAVEMERRRADPGRYCHICGRKLRIERGACPGVHPLQTGRGPLAHVTNDPGTAGPRCKRCNLTGHDADGCDLRHGAQWFASLRPGAGT